MSCQAVSFHVVSCRVMSCQIILFPDILGVRMVCRDKKASPYQSTSRNEERLSPRGETAGEPLVNRGCCSCLGLHRIRFVRAFAETSRTAELVGRTEAVNTQLSSEYRSAFLNFRMEMTPFAKDKVCCAVYILTLIFPDMPCMKKVYEDN